MLHAYRPKLPHWFCWMGYARRVDHAVAVAAREGSDRMNLHLHAFASVEPTERRQQEIALMRAAAQTYAQSIEQQVPLGAQRIHILRDLVRLHDATVRAILYHDDGEPRSEARP